MSDGPRMYTQKELDQELSSAVADIIRLTGERDALKAQLRVTLRALKEVEQGKPLKPAILYVLDSYQEQIDE